MPAETGAPRFWTRDRLRADLVRLGLRPGDTVMAHAALTTPSTWHGFPASGPPARSWGGVRFPRTRDRAS